MALPLYPQLKLGLEKWLTKIFEAAAQKELGPFADSPRFTQHEGTSHNYSTVDGDERSTDFQEIRVEIQLSQSQIINMSMQDLATLVIEKGQEFGAGQARFHYQVLNSIIEETGNVTSAQGGPLTLDLLFETFDKVHVSFDDSGNPQMPTIVVPPDMGPRFQELISEAEGDESARARVEEILQRKREEWNEEQDRRKLVD